MIWILCIYIFFLSSCEQKPQERHYNEIVIEPPQESGNLSWDVPQGWKQEAGEGMRLASFHPVSDAKTIDCSIVSLSGAAGGLEANLNRWMGQLGLEVSDDHLKQLILSAQDVQTKGGIEAKVFDFTNLQAQGSPSDKSMIAAMINVDLTTVFIKMTGSMGSVKQYRDDFLKLLRSIVRQ